MTEIKDKTIWSRRVRFFHWANAFCVIALITLGFIMSGDGKYLGISFSHHFVELLTPFHIAIGAILTSLLIYRIDAMFNPNDKGESFSEVNPLTKENINELKHMGKKENGYAYKYHNPIGRFMVAAWFVVLIFQATTGTVLSYQHLSGSTDVSSIVVGNAYAHGSSGHESASVIQEPSSKTNVQKMTSEHKPDEDNLLATVHGLTMYLIVLMLFAHLGGVLKESLRIRQNLVSKMIYGK